MAESGGWLVKYGTILSMDKALDKDLPEAHRFVEQRKVLVEAKVQNPSMRVSSSSNIFGSPDESVSLNEVQTMGLRAPKKKIWTLAKYTKTYGAPPPEKIRTVEFNGQKVQGVDVMNSEERRYWFYFLSLIVNCEL